MDKIIEKIKEINNEESIALTNLDVLLLSSEKTGTVSLFCSFKNIGYNCTHLHSYNYFIYRNSILQNELLKYSFKDFINNNYINNNKYPLIISIYREPISRILSLYLFLGIVQQTNINRKHFLNNFTKYYGFMPLLNEEIIYSFLKNNYYDKLNKNVYKKYDSYHILITTFDNLDNISKIINEKLTISNFNLS